MSGLFHLNMRRAAFAALPLAAISIANLPSEAVANPAPVHDLNRLRIQFGHQILAVVRQGDQFKVFPNAEIGSNPEGPGVDLMVFSLASGSQGLFTNFISLTNTIPGSVGPVVFRAIPGHDGNLDMWPVKGFQDDHEREAAREHTLRIVAAFNRAIKAQLIKTARVAADSIATNNVITNFIDEPEPEKTPNQPSIKLSKESQKIEINGGIYTATPAEDGQTINITQEGTNPVGLRRLSLHLQKQSPRLSIGSGSVIGGKGSSFTSITYTEGGQIAVTACSGFEDSHAFGVAYAQTIIPVADAVIKAFELPRASLQIDDSKITTLDGRKDGLCTTPYAAPTSQKPATNAAASQQTQTTKWLPARYMYDHLGNGDISGRTVKKRFDGTSEIVEIQEVYFHKYGAAYEVKHKRGERHTASELAHLVSVLQDSHVLERIPYNKVADSALLDIKATAVFDTGLAHYVSASTTDSTFSKLSGHTIDRSSDAAVALQPNDTTTLAAATTDQRQPTSEHLITNFFASHNSNITAIAFGALAFAGAGAAGSLPISPVLPPIPFTDSLAAVRAPANRRGFALRKKINDITTSVLSRVSQLQNSVARRAVTVRNLAIVGMGATARVRSSFAAAASEVTLDKITQIAKRAALYAYNNPAQVLSSLSSTGAGACIGIGLKVLTASSIAALGSWAFVGSAGVAVTTSFVVPLAINSCKAIRPRDNTTLGQRLRNAVVVSSKQSCDSGLVGAARFFVRACRGQEQAGFNFATAKHAASLLFAGFSAVAGWHAASAHGLDHALTVTPQSADFSEPSIDMDSLPRAAPPQLAAVPTPVEQTSAILTTAKPELIVRLDQATDTTGTGLIGNQIKSAFTEPQNDPLNKLRTLAEEIQASTANVHQLTDSPAWKLLSLKQQTALLAELANPGRNPETLAKLAHDVAWRMNDASSAAFQAHKPVGIDYANFGLKIAEMAGLKNSAVTHMMRDLAFMEPKLPHPANIAAAGATLRPAA